MQQIPSYIKVTKNIFQKYKSTFILIYFALLLELLTETARLLYIIAGSLYSSSSLLSDRLVGGYSVPITQLFFSYFEIWRKHKLHSSTQFCQTYPTFLWILCHQEFFRSCLSNLDFFKHFFDIREMFCCFMIAQFENTPLFEGIC